MFFLWGAERKISLKQQKQNRDFSRTVRPRQMVKELKKHFLLLLNIFTRNCLI